MTIYFVKADDYSIVVNDEDIVLDVLDYVVEV